MSVQKPREIAAQILRRRETGADYVENLLESALATTPLSTKDRGLCQELVYGIARWQAALDWLSARKTGGRTQKPALNILLRLGLYQIFWLERIPNHAAVNETVELAKRNGFGAQAGFVNAILRGYLRELDATKKLLAELKTTQPHLGYSHPEWLVARWQKRWGSEKAAQLMDWNNTPPPIYGRVNTLKTDAAKLTEQWRAEGVQFVSRRWDWTGEGLLFELESFPPLAGLASFQQGLFYVQDPSTLLAVRELNPQSGETVLDLCAAPGGKTTFIAQLLSNEGRIVAQDVSDERLKLVEENCARLGVTCVEVRNSRSKEALISKFGSSQSLLTSAATKREFDRVLLDAPCSNTGVMRRRVDLRWRIQSEEITRLRATQLDLLKQAASLVKPDGILVYSTCSLEPEENQEVTQRFLGDHNEFELEHERELLPFVDGVDGAYVARFARAV